jgi:hypothetical protein
VHPHQAWLIFPSRWNVRHKMAIATLCVLCGEYCVAFLTWLHQDSSGDLHRECMVGVGGGGGVPQCSGFTTSGEF